MTNKEVEERLKKAFDEASRKTGIPLPDDMTGHIKSLDGLLKSISGIKVINLADAYKDLGIDPPNPKAEFAKIWGAIEKNYETKAGEKISPDISKVCEMLYMAGYQSGGVKRGKMLAKTLMMFVKGLEGE